MKTVRTTEAFDLWFSGLRDKQGKARIEARFRRVELGNFGDVKPVGRRRQRTARRLRSRLAQRGLEVVVLLEGGDKSAQEKDIKTALELARQL